MKKYIRYHLTYGLLIGSVMLAGACKVQKKVTKAPPKRVAVQSTQVERTVDKPVTSSLGKVSLINRDLSIHPALLAFMDLFGLKHNGSMESVRHALQVNFLRKPGQERRDIKGNPTDRQKHAQALQLLRQMGMVDKASSSPAQADYFLLFGAMVPTMKKRTQNFVEQLQKGMRSKNLVLLTGARKLRSDEIKELKKCLNSFYNGFLSKIRKQEEELTEADALFALWDTQVPAAIKAQFEEGKNLFFVNATDTTKGTNNRPTTEAVIEAWYNTCLPAPGHCHVNVEMPYGVRMEKVLRTFLLEKSKGVSEGTKNFSISWNSPAAYKTLQMGVYKDELARAFYQECKLKGHI